MIVTEVVLGAIALAAVGWALTYMLAQKPVTGVQQLIQQGKFEEAMAAAQVILDAAPNDTGALLHHAEAAKLLGRFEEALGSYGKLMARESSDAAAREGVALTLAYLNRDLPRAVRIMEETVQSYPAIQEFQALALSYVLLRAGRREEALRLYDDNAVLLQTRFDVDYTDRDPLLAETLHLYAILAKESGDDAKARELQQKVREWAPASAFAFPAQSGSQG